MSKPTQESARAWAERVLPKVGEAQHLAAVRQRSTFGAMHPGFYELAVAYVRLAAKAMREELEK